MEEGKAHDDEATTIPITPTINVSNPPMNSQSVIMNVLEVLRKGTKLTIPSMYLVPIDRQTDRQIERMQLISTKKWKADLISRMFKSN